MNPVIKYRGGKSKEIPQFQKYFPADYSRYIEPFLGGGAVYFYLEPKNAVINDLNSKLMTFYMQLRDSYPLMRKQLDDLEALYEANQAEYLAAKLNDPDGYVINRNEELYYQVRDRFNHPDSSMLEGVSYFFINKTSYSGMIRYNSKGEYNVPYGRYAHFNTHLITDAHSRLLQNAEIYCKDYSEVFSMAKEDDFMFLDPPYDCIFNDYGNTETEDGFNEREHRRLAEAFRNLSCRALMVIGKTDLTMELYGKYVVDEYYKNYAVNIKNRFNNGKMHIVVKNY